MEAGFDGQIVYGERSLADKKRERRVSSSSQTAVTVYDSKEQLNMI